MCFSPSTDFILIPLNQKLIYIGMKAPGIASCVLFFSASKTKIWTSRDLISSGNGSNIYSNMSLERPFRTNFFKSFHFPSLLQSILVHNCQLILWNLLQHIWIKYGGFSYEWEKNIPTKIVFGKIITQKQKGVQEK